MVFVKGDVAGAQDAVIMKESLDMVSVSRPGLLVWVKTA
jgi:hypothetical protein